MTQAPSRAVVLDACVLLPITLCDFLLEIAEAGYFEPLWSDEILGEVERNLVTQFHVPLPDATRRVEIMQRAFPDASVVHYEETIEAMRNDPKDRHVAAAAVRGEASLIITANLRDFSESALAPHGIRAVHPDVFLSELFTADPDGVLEVVQRKRASFSKPPMTLHELLARLSKTVPQFAEAVELHLR